MISAPSLEIQDFNPFTRWERVQTAASEHSSFDMDQSAGRLYLRGGDRYAVVTILKEAFFSGAAQGVQSIAAALTRLFRVVALVNLWEIRDQPYSLQGRLMDTASDLGRLALIPVTYTGMLLSVGILAHSPLTARKLYASFERLAYGDLEARRAEMQGSWYQHPEWQPYSMGGELEEVSEIQMEDLDDIEWYDFDSSESTEAISSGTLSSDESDNEL